MIPKRLVMIDDDPTFLYRARLAAQSSACGVELICNGEADKALECLRLQPDLRNVILVTDLSMPGMTGFDVIAKVRTDEKLCHVPILVLTFSVAQQDMIRCYRLGAQGFLTKPMGAAALENMFVNLAGMWKFYAGEEEWLENAQHNSS